MEITAIRDTNLAAVSVQQGKLDANRKMADCKTKTLPFAVYLPSFHLLPPKIALQVEEWKPNICLF